jgi:hypothetical protein
MQVPFIDLKREYKLLKPKINARLIEVASSGSFILGGEVLKFEKNISRYLNSQALGCASGSDAILLSLMAIGVKEGDEVITTSFSFVATAMTIVRLGARPVFVDISEKTFNICPELIERAVTKKTKAILIVHLFGNPVDMDFIEKIAKRNNIALVEDACQAIGAEYDGKKVGTIGDFGCFSFFPTKNLGGYGDGGLIVCRNKRNYELLKKLRVHGAIKKYEHELIGINSRLDEIQATVLNIKLNYLDGWNDNRKKIAKKYDQLLISAVAKQATAEKAKHCYHQYAIFVKNRSSFVNFLKNKKIDMAICYPRPLHLQKCFRYLGYKKGDLPVSEKISNMIISLPIFPLMTVKEIDYVIKSINDFFNDKV